MAENRPSSSPSKATAASSDSPEERWPSKAELLEDLRKHGVKTAPPMPLPLISRRTRDYLLVAGVASYSLGRVIFYYRRYQRQRRESGLKT